MPIRLEVLFIFFLGISYSPFLFSLLMPENIRILVFVFVLLTVFFIVFHEVGAWNILFLLALFLVLVFSNYGSVSGLRSAGNLVLHMFLGYLLYLYLSSSLARFSLILKTYTALVYVAIASSVISLVYFYFFGEFDLFGLSSTNYSFSITPFGVIFRKFFWGAEVPRSIFYFVEPVYAGVFYAINIFLVSPFLKEKSIFIGANIIGGIMAFSVAFWTVIFFLVVLRRTGKNNYFIYFSLFFFAFVLYNNFLGALVDTSFSDRFERFINFFNSMLRANLHQILFGHGFLVDNGSDKAFSSGGADYIFYAGAIATVMMLYMFRKIFVDRILFFLLLLLLLIIDPFRIPLFYVAVAIFSVGSRIMCQENMGHRKKTCLQGGLS